MRVLTKIQSAILISAVFLFLLGTSIFLLSQTPIDVDEVVKDFKLHCYAPPAECNCRAEVFKDKLRPKEFNQMVSVINETDALDALVLEGRLVNSTVSAIFVEAVIYCSN